MEDHRLSRSDLEGLDGFDRLQALHEVAFGILYADRAEELTPSMRALTVLLAFTGDIGNGGFAACMYNWSGDLTGDAIEAARLVGAHPHAAVFESFLATAMNGDQAIDAAARERRLDAMSDEEEAALVALDDEIFALQPIDEVLTAYVDSHVAEFVRD